jgi:hypothetical protein
MKIAAILNVLSTLPDGLLDFCFDPELLPLYKRLCRYYFDINPEATADYVGFYRELWDRDNDDSCPSGRRA